MKRKPLFSFGMSIFWICMSILLIDTTRMRIAFERSHGVTLWQSYAFLIIGIAMLITSLWSCWISHKARKEYS